MIRWAETVFRRHGLVEPIPPALHRLNRVTEVDLEFGGFSLSTTIGDEPRASFQQISEGVPFVHGHPFARTEVKTLDGVNKHEASARTQVLSRQPLVAEALANSGQHTVGRDQLPQALDLEQSVLDVIVVEVLFRFIPKVRMQRGAAVLDLAEHQRPASLVHDDDVRVVLLLLIVDSRVTASTLSLRSGTGTYSASTWLTSSPNKFTF